MCNLLRTLLEVHLQSFGMRNSNLGESKLYFTCLDKLFTMVYSNSSLEMLLFGDFGTFPV